MVQVDINNVLAVNPEEMSSQEKDDLYENLIWLDLEPEVPPDQFDKLFKITKEVLKYKGEQVEALLVDLDVLASNTGIGVDEMRDELVKASKQTEQLVEEIQAKDRELDKEKAQVEKLLSEITDLQKEKSELRREMILMQNEAQAGISSGMPEDNADDLAQLKETLQYKNKHILQLLNDTEILEKENEMLTTKLNSVRRELSDATTNLTKLSGENISLRAANYELQEKVTSLEERNSGLSSQVSELVNEKNRRDTHLDQLIDALEERVAKWQDVFSYKENEVAELKAKLSEMSQVSEPKTSTQFATNYTILAKTIEQQEDMIEQLKNQLRQAGEDLNKSTNEMHQYKKIPDEEPQEEMQMKVEALRDELDKALTQVSFLQEKVKDAEQDAQFRAEEMTELIIQLREYEEGVYGLSEARAEVKELKKQIAVRDKQILNLVQQFNNSDLNLGDKQSIESIDELDDKTSTAELKMQLNQIQQTAINLSVQNFDLKAQVMRLNEQLTEKKPETDSEIKTDVAKEEKEESSAAENEKDKQYIKELGEKLEGVIHENESLRKGLHEIMESIKSQDGMSRVSIESECLEKLLEVLDSRHVSGWYHPAMRLQVALSKLQGNNDALRQQLRETRFRECYFQAELQSAFLKIGELEGKISNADINGLPPIPAPRVIKAKGEESETEKIDEVDDVQNGHDMDEQKIEEQLQNGDSNRFIISELSKDTGSESKSNEEISVIERKVMLVESSTQTDSPALSKKGSEESVDQPSSKPKLSRQGSVREEMSIDKDIKETPVDKDINETPVEGEVKETPPEPDKSLPESRRQSGGLENGQQSPVVKADSRPPSSKQEHAIDDEEERQRKFLLNEVIEEMKAKTDNVLDELKETKEQIFGDIKSTMDKVTEHFEALKKEPPLPPPPVYEQSKEFKEHEERIAHYGQELATLKSGMDEKEKTVLSLQSEIDHLKNKLEESHKAVRAQQTNKKILALKETVKGLQAIIQQKEGVIERCENMLQENSKEYDKLLDQYRELEFKLLHQQQPPTSSQLANSKAVSVLMQKWIVRVEGLENDIRILNTQLQDTTEAMFQAKHDAEKWKNHAEKLQEKEEAEGLSEKFQEIEERRNIIKEMKGTIEELKAKLRLETGKHKKREEELKSKLKEQDAEIHRLKHHRSTSRLYPQYPQPSAVSSGKKELALMDRIKELEQELTISNERQKTILQQRKDRCADEVAKWEEKKKLQTANEKLRNELKDRNLQLEELESQITRLKQIITRMERERITLQRRLKVTEGSLSKSLLGLAKDEDDREFTESRLGMTPRSESSCSDIADQKINLQSRKDLIKAVGALRKVVAKLRSQHSNYVHKDYVEQLQKELQKMEENYLDAVERSLALEEQLREAEAKPCNQTYSVDAPGVNPPGVVFLKEQLNQKCELLGKVKILLQRAMVREKQLLQQVR